MYWIISIFIKEDNFEKLSPQVAIELEATLLGNWARATEEGMMLVKFGKNSMSFTNFKVGKTNATEVSVIYQNLEDSWGIDLISFFGEVEGQMMVVHEGPDKILFGAPGLPLVEFYRETKTGY